MTAILDETIILDKNACHLDVQSPQRRTIDRTVPGLDAVTSIDLGADSRKIVQTGTLRAISWPALREKISKINALIDGGIHILSIDDQMYENLRIDSFTTDNFRNTATGLAVDYRIRYTQLEI